MEKVYIFNGANSHLPNAVFKEYGLASSWIEANKLTGLLTAYPVDVSVYDWQFKVNFLNQQKIIKRKRSSYSLLRRLRLSIIISKMGKRLVRFIQLSPAVPKI